MKLNRFGTRTSAIQFALLLSFSGAAAAASAPSPLAAAPGDGWQSLSPAAASAEVTTASAQPSNKVPRANLAVAPGVMVGDSSVAPVASLAPGEMVLPAASAMPVRLPVTADTGTRAPAVAAAAPTLAAAGMVPVAVSAAQTPLVGNRARAIPAVAQVGLPPFILHPGDHVTTVLAQWLYEEGWKLDWSAQSGVPGRLRDLVSDADYFFTPSNVNDLLRTVLAGYGFSADVDSSAQRRIVVRNDNNVTE